MKKGQVAIFLFLILITVGFLMIRKPKSIEEIFREDAILGEKIPVVIVPHFNSFADKRAELLADVGKKTSAKTIVLVSVNHFNSGSENILTTDKTWLVSGGEVSAEKTLVEKISDDKIAANDETAFAQEHGIANIIPDIYKFSPKAKVLPIIIKDQTGKGQIDKLSN
ncbi:MAG: Encapsulation protein CapA, partial [Candidatus Berkelbacteria bacterium Athens1014_28]